MTARRPARAPVLIVGAGPAGCALGVLLTGRGVPCVVLDRAAFPRAKPCGELLNPGAVCALARLRLLDDVLGHRPAQIQRWSLRAEGERWAVGAYSTEGPWGLGIARNVLDATLVSVARARGVPIHEETTVGRIRRVADEWLVDARGPGGARVQWRAGILVGADGLRSVVARRLALVRRPPAPNKLSLTCHMLGTGPDRGQGYLLRRHGRTVGVAPIHASQPLWNVTVVADTPEYARAARRDRMQLFWDVVREADLPWHDDPTTTAGPWASGGFRYPVSRPVTDGALLVGDAAGYYDPFTGQGIHQALRSAELAAPIVDRAWRDRHSAHRRLRAYGAVLRRQRLGSAVFQRGVEFVMKHGRLRETVVDALRVGPGYADAVVQVAGDSRSLAALGRIDAWFSRKPSLR